MSNETSSRRWVRHLRSPWLVGLALIALASVLGWLMFFSPVFSARTIVVVGSEQVTDDQVRDAAGVPAGMSLARLPLTDIAARIEELDAVASARVERQWPNTVRIVVTERRAVAVVHRDDGFGVVGSDGVTYRVVASRPDDLPMLERLTSEAASSTSWMSGDASVAAFTVARELPRAFARRVELITADSVRDVELTLRSGVVVQWGNAGNTQSKAEVVVQLLDRHASHYDVSVPEAPAWSG
jgi:cell division protein FtsQ